MYPSKKQMYPSLVQVVRDDICKSERVIELKSTQKRFAYAWPVIFRQDMPESPPMEIPQTVTDITDRTKNGPIKYTGNSCWHFSNNYTLTDEYYHCLTSGAKTDSGQRWHPSSTFIIATEASHREDIL